MYVCTYVCDAVLGPLLFAFLQVRSLEKELELHKQHKPKSGRSGRTAVSGWEGWV